MKTSVYNTSRAVTTIAPDVIAATANGATVDRQSTKLSHFRSAMLVVVAGVVTDGTHAIKLQDSPNGTDWTDVPTARLQGSAISLTAANDEAVHEQGYTGSARYLRAVTTVSGTPATGGTYGAVIVMSGARRTPIPRS